MFGKEVIVKKDGKGRIHHIEGFCYAGKKDWKTSVISFSCMHGVWITSSSMCLPSDIFDAKEVHETCKMAFNRLNHTVTLEAGLW